MKNLRWHSLEKLKRLKLSFISPKTVRKEVLVLPRLLFPNTWHSSHNTFNLPSNQCCCLLSCCHLQSKTPFERLVYVDCLNVLSHLQVNDSSAHVVWVSHLTIILKITFQDHQSTSIANSKLTFQLLSLKLALCRVCWINEDCFLHYQL